MKTDIKESELSRILKQAFKEAEGVGWTGWGIPIYVDPDGGLSKGTMISNSSWQPDKTEVTRVKHWDMFDRGYEDYNEYDVDCEVEDIAEWVIGDLIEKERSYPEEYSWRIV